MTERNNNTIKTPGKERDISDRSVMVLIQFGGLILKCGAVILYLLFLTIDTMNKKNLTLTTAPQKKPGREFSNTPFPKHLNIHLLSAGLFYSFKMVMNGTIAEKVTGFIGEDDIVLKSRRIPPCIHHLYFIMRILLTCRIKGEAGTVFLNPHSPSCTIFYRRI